ncbi:RagB/SusD family nutrient uptake outer membrane protein [Echinicola strongylocentroti]|nr:RagB/SusD family nutrient uptake outer membrane protein [Echinicola strongylocentroti]
MKHRINHFHKIMIIALIHLLNSCDAFLDPRPDRNVVVPETLEDIRALLDNTVVFNLQPGLPTIATDEFYTTDEGWEALSNPAEQATYLWGGDPYQGGVTNVWTGPYEQVFYANVALQALQELGGEKVNEYYELMGTAHFHKAYAYSQLLQVFTALHRPDGSNEDALGIVLRAGPDVQVTPRRASLARSFNALLDDLQMAMEYLPEQSSIASRPTKAAAYGLQARVAMMMQDYSLAREAASEVLGRHTVPLDFNTLDMTASRPFEDFNEEVVFYAHLQNYSFMNANLTFVDPGLMGSYGEGDLRKQLYYTLTEEGDYQFTGKLTGNSRFFGGISVGEMLLVAAEASYRTGDGSRAKTYLEQLMENRYEKGKAPSLEGVDDENLLVFILDERRKELVGRGLRWFDLRRLNQDPITAKTLQRTLEGQEFILEPKSEKYIFPIPPEEIRESGIEQNPR